MKKIIVSMLCALFCIGGLYAEKIRFTVTGSEGRYNQVKLVNKTKASNFDCLAYFLDKDGEKYIAREPLGAFHLGEMSSKDTCTSINLIDKGTHIGIVVPDEVGPVSYVV
ncbi:MAG: hypothetical protein IJM03_14475, partial [Treponema sp.]|nr:hypothetical protein [Treponema sp.]